MAAVAVSSAAPILALLKEEDEVLRHRALERLNALVSDYWFQISESLPLLEELFENDKAKDRGLAALVASKVYYHLGELDEAVNLALGAGALLDVSEPTEYSQTILSRCIDQYVALRTKADDAGEEAQVDARLEAVVERVFDRCLSDTRFDHAVGLSLESRRLDRLRGAIEAAGPPGHVDRTAILDYALSVAKKTVGSREFRRRAFRLLVELYEQNPSPDYCSICLVLMTLDDAKEVAQVLHRLLSGSDDDALTAYQAGFDLVDNEIQLFLRQVREHLAAHAPPKPAEGGAAAAADGAAAAPAVGSEEEAARRRYHDRASRLDQVLRGDSTIAAHLQFLYSRNKSDLGVLKNIKAAFEPRNSVLYSATILANSLMHCGTTSDAFLRENLDWLGRAANWAKFSATASLGAIHRGHLSQSRALMAPYLPRNGQSGSPYAEGGALYALGLIHANHGEGILPFLLESLNGTANEVVQHGACLGLGLAGLSTFDEATFDAVKTVLYTDSAVAGEAAGIAMGLIQVGSATERATEMLAYAHETQHEKIIRGLAMGLSLIMYGRESGADGLVEQMARDQDPILRYGGMYVVGLAYCGTASNQAIQRLLHFAVSDVSDDVRRAAVLNLGFVLCGAPEQCPRIVSLLAESYNPHARYGAAMAVGIACAGTGLRSALALLEPLQSDPVDFVRQGALIATALVLVSQPEAQCSSFRGKLERVVGEKHEATMCKMGAIVATGILNAGGRNCTVALKPGGAFPRMTSVVGMALFTQYWYWYPLSYFLALSFQPSAVIGVNADLKLPKLSLDCRCRPSLFAYPPPVQERQKHEVGKVEKAVLSTTAKARERQKKKDAEKKKTGDAPAAAAGTSAAAAAPPAEPSSAMDVDEAPSVSGAGGDAAKAAAGAAKAEGAPAKEAPEPSSFSLENPSRVLPDQERHLRLVEGSRWVPVRPRGRITAGITVFKDLSPEEPVELVTDAVVGQPAAPAAAPAAPAPAAPAQQRPAGAEEDEAPPPAPFQYNV